jgi:hypothetical protein
LIKYLAHTEIEKNRWDLCIRQSVNRLPYAVSWWLNIVSPGWDALVQDDYMAVMPLTWNRKLGINYLFQPYLTQQLGIFSPGEISPEQEGEFLEAIPDKFRYADIHLNAMNHPVNTSFHFTSRNNFTLDLTPDYIQLLTNYHRNCRRNVQKAIHSGFSVKPGPGPSVFADFVEKNLDRKIHDIGKIICPVMQKITRESIQQGFGEILGVYKPDGKLLAAGWFHNDMERCFFMVCASTPEGKKNQAMYLLVDQVIKNKSGTELIFDFTGSNMPGVAYFNAGFGAIKSNYPAAKKNLLPWPISLFKK